MSTNAKVGEPRLCFEGRVRLPAHDYSVEIGNQVYSVRVYDRVAYAANLYDEEMKQFVAVFVSLALASGWPLVLDERTAIPAAEYLGWSKRFKQGGQSRVM
jgi:hypothetical protein